MFQEAEKAGEKGYHIEPATREKLAAGGRKGGSRSTRTKNKVIFFCI